MICEHVTVEGLSGKLYRQSSGSNCDCCLVFLHGAGLENCAPLYHSIGAGLCSAADILVVNIRASGFLRFESSFRNPLGWAVHVCEEVMVDMGLWRKHLESLDYKRLISGGHSWGALVTAALFGRDWPTILLSPIVDVESILRVNLGDKFSPDDLDSIEDADLVQCQPRAPFPVLSKRTINSLLQYTLSIPKKSQLKNCMTFMGDMEHPKIQEAIWEWDPQVRSIPKQGHFFQKKDNQLHLEMLQFIVDQ